MKKIIGIIIISFLILIPKSYSKSIGEGELKLDDDMIRYFHQYLKGKGNQRPMMFTIAVDGSHATYWYCPANQCQGSSPVQFTKLCELEAGIECKVFARGRYIKWKNGINLGKGKASKVESNQSFNDLKARLTELGFVGGSSSTTTTTTPKITKKATGNNLDLTKELKELKALLDTDILTQDEFNELKENLLKKYKE